jgi:hypothetical protein
MGREIVNTCIFFPGIGGGKRRTVWRLGCEGLRCRKQERSWFHHVLDTRLRRQRRPPIPLSWVSLVGFVVGYGWIRRRQIQRKYLHNKHLRNMVLVSPPLHFIKPCVATSYARLFC